MLRGTITKGYSTFAVQVGPVTVDISDDVRALLAEEKERADREIAEIRAEHADLVKRYNQITSIVLAGGRHLPTA